MEGMCLREQAKSIFFLSIQQIFFECLLETLHCSRHQGLSSE